MKLDIQAFQFGEHHCSAFIPDYNWIQENYVHEIGQESFPFWAKLWPSSLALCEFLATNPHIVQNKTVLELAAGLGLPSILISSFASSVICSDISTEAIDIVEGSVALNQLTNVSTKVLNWFDRDSIPSADVILLSDVNYHATALDALYELICQHIERGATILLTTPERIVARDFLHKLQSFQVEHHSQKIEDEYIHLYIYENPLT